MNMLKILPRLLVEATRDPKKVALTAAHRARRTLVRDIVEGRSKTAILVTLGHALISYAGLCLLGETDLVANAVRFFYYYVVTGSSVGYGDFSPTTTAGEFFVAVWVIPGALAIFAIILTKLIGSLALMLRKFMSGFGNYANSTGHIVIVGYVAGQTEGLLAETKDAQDSSDTIIVTTTDNLPLPDRIARVRTTTLSNTDNLVRAGVCGAKSIVVMAQSDNETMTVCLALSALKTPAHVVAYFRDAGQANLVRPHCPGFEFVVSTSVQQVSRAIVDPGASKVFAQLASTSLGATLHSVDYDGGDTTVGALRAKLQTLNATLIGYQDDHDHEPILEINDQMRIGQEHTLIYISAQRITPDALEA
jgi:voltage-gated potassium channel